MQETGATATFVWCISATKLNNRGSCKSAGAFFIGDNEMELNFTEINGLLLETVLELFERHDFELLETTTVHSDLEREVFDSRHGFRIIFDYHYSDGRCYNYRIVF